MSTAEALDHVADRLRATVERFGTGSVAVLASGEQTNEEAHAWARRARRGAGRRCQCLRRRGRALVGAARAVCRRRSRIWRSAATIVVAGDADLDHRAPVLELWIRKGVRNGARVVTVGPGATRLDTLRGAAHISAAPGTSHTVLLEAAAGEGELAGHLGEPGTILIWSGAMRAEVASVLAHVAHTSGCTVLRTPRAANEIGCTAAGLGTVTPDQALEQAERGEIRAMVLLGADPVGDWHSGERWRTALSRCFFALQVTAFQNDSSGWVTTIVPATATLEKDGTRDEPRGPGAARPRGGHASAGRLRRLRLGGRAGQPACASTCPTTRRARSPTWPPAGPHSPACRGRRSASSAPLGERPAAGAAPPVPQLGPAAELPETVVVGYRELMSGAAVDHTPQLQFQRRRGIEIAHADAERLGLATGEQHRGDRGRPHPHRAGARAARAAPRRRAAAGPHPPRRPGQRARRAGGGRRCLTGSSSR